MTGIPIKVILNKYNGQDCGPEPHKSRPSEADAPQDGEAAVESELVKDIEKEFTGEAEEILDRLHLSHLKPGAKKVPTAPK